MADKDFDRLIAEYYREMELDIIASMKRNLSRHLKEESDVEFDFAQWQAIKLKELKRYQRQNGRIVSGVSHRVSKEVSKHILEELSQGSKKEMRRFKEIMGDKYESAVTMKDSFFKINDRKINSLITSLSGDLHKANSAALRMVNDTYRDVIFKASFFASNGVKTPKQAVDMAMRDFLQRGINCIEYKDGRRVNIASYTSMAVRTASQRAYLIGEGSRRQEEGVPFIKISRHNTSCELCKPFEGKILIDDVYSGGKDTDGDYMLLSTAMEQGLFHPNCRHGCSTHYPELDDFEYTPELDEETQREDQTDEEDERAKQTQLEFLMQKYRRHIVGSLNEDTVTLNRRKLKEAETALESVETIAISGNSGIMKSALNGNLGSDLFSKEARELLYRDERIIAGNKYEKAIIYDENGKHIFSKKGTQNSVGFTKSELKKMKGCVITHNHPSGSGFSSDDIWLMRSTKAVETRVCVSDGTFVIRRPTKWPDELCGLQDVEKAINDIYDEVGYKYRELAAQRGERIYTYMSLIERETFEIFGQRYGFEFKWEAK